MARKKPEDMELMELKELIKWYENRLMYCKFIIQTKFGSHA